MPSGNVHGGRSFPFFQESRMKRSPFRLLPSLAVLAGIAALIAAVAG